MSEAAQARQPRRWPAAGCAAAEAAAAREVLAAGGEQAVRNAMEVWELLEDSAGRLTATEDAVFSSYPEHEQAELIGRQFHHETSMLLEVLELLAQRTGEAGHASPAFRSLFDATVRRGADFDEEHPLVVPGALTGLGVTMATSPPSTPGWPG
jgi:hypothetical protein